MNREDLFYKELASCPELPSTEFNNICKRIHRRVVIKRISIVGSVSVILLATVFGIANFSGTGNKPVHPEVAAELQIIQEYLDGNDLGDQIETYAYFEDD